MKIRTTAQASDITAGRGAGLVQNEPVCFCRCYSVDKNLFFEDPVVAATFCHFSDFFRNNSAILVSIGDNMNG